MSRSPDASISCRAILQSWRSNPDIAFPPPYEELSRLIGQLGEAPGVARLVDGIVVRVGRGDPPPAIEKWAERFAARRGISLPPHGPRRSAGLPGGPTEPPPSSAPA